MQIDSISSFRIYSSWTTQAAKIKNLNEIKGKADDNETKAIEKQLEAAAEEAGNVQSTGQTNNVREVSSLPWANLMYKLNLRPTGDYTKDYHATISRLDELIKYTQNPDKLQEYLNMADEVSRAFVQPQVSSMTQNISSMSGSEQIAQLNRVIMVNMSAK